MADGESTTKIICRLPEYEAAIGDLVSHLVSSLMRARDPIFGSIRHEVVDHLPGESAPENTAIGVMHPVLASYKCAIDVKALIDADLDAWATMISDAADEGLASVMPQFFSMLEDTSAKAGTSVDARGKPFSWDLFIDGIEAMEVDFDEQGKPKVTFVTGPEVFRRLEALGPPSDAQRARLDRVFAAKKADHDARRRVRRLA